MPNDDIFQSIRDAVDQTLEMAEATAKISEETKDILAELTLTRRSDGEVMLDITALERMKASENQWVDNKKSRNDNLVNPTRLPQLVAGLQGLQSSQYLAFVQRPLERNGDNGPFLERKSLKLYKQYQAKELAKERNQAFGHYQRFVAKLLIDEVLRVNHPNSSPEEIDKVRETLSPQKQFELAATTLGIATSDVMDRLFKYSVAFSIIETITSKVSKIEKSRSIFENAMRKLAAQDTGPASKTRIKELFLSFQSDIEKMAKTAKTFHNKLNPILEKTKGDQFDQTFSNLHREAAKLDASITRWVIIISEANNTKSPRSPVERIKGMHKVLKG